MHKINWHGKGSDDKGKPRTLQTQAEQKINKATF